MRFVFKLPLALLIFARAASAQFSISPLSSFGGGDGWLAPGEGGYVYLGTSGNERGLAFGNHHLYLVSRNGGNNIRILDPLTGADLGSLSTSNVSGGTFQVNMIAVCSDGVIYLANLTTQASSSPYKVYRWATESSLPTVAYSGAPIAGGRIGDSLAIIGSGSSTLLAAGFGSTPSVAGNNGYAIINPTAGTASQVAFAATPPDAGDFRLGITFSDPNHILGTQGNLYRYTSFSTASGTLLASPAIPDPAGAVADRLMAYAIVGGVPLLAVQSIGDSRVSLYDVTDPTNPIFLGSGNSTSGTLAANGTGNGFLAWGDISGNTAHLWAMSANQGIQAFVIAAPLAVGVRAATIDSGGSHATNGVYANDASLGGIGGVATAISPQATARNGYIGQLYEVAGLGLIGSPAAVNEGNGSQLSGVASLDDATVTRLSFSDITWSIGFGPITQIDYLAGTAVAGIVASNTFAGVRGSSLGLTNSLSLLVLDSDPDNYGSYAGDGLPDCWQIQYFGFGNANAVPGLDADGDGQSNFFEYLAGTSPIDSGSKFILTIENVPGQPTRKNLIFGPRAVGRAYAFEFRTNLLAGAWTPLTGTTQTDNGLTRTATDLNAIQAAKFYRLNLSFAPVQLLSPSRTGNAFSFQLETVPCFNYFVEYKDALTDPTWQPLPLAFANVVAGNGAIQTITDTNASGAQRFYRARR